MFACQRCAMDPMCQALTLEWAELVPLNWKGASPIPTARRKRVRRVPIALVTTSPRVLSVICGCRSEQDDPVALRGRGPSETGGGCLQVPMLDRKPVLQTGRRFRARRMLNTNGSVHE
jgi:hypothetical protein